MPSKKTKARSVSVPDSRTPKRPATGTEHQPRPLSDLQATIADELADMLVNGGHDETCDLMISAAAHHKWHRWTRQCESDPAKVQAEVDKSAPAEFRKWKLALIDEWIRNRNAPPAEQADPATATERIREMILRSLRDSFAGFLVSSTPEERYCMREILTDHYSRSHGNDYDQLGLAEAFELSLSGRSGAFLRVPDRFRGQVQTYLELLEGAEDAV